MRVLAWLPELNPPSTPVAVPDPVVEQRSVAETDVEPPAVPAAVIEAPVRPPARRGRAGDAPRFPLGSIVALSVAAAACWASVWWHERSVAMGVGSRPERLARELETEPAGRETITP